MGNEVEEGEKRERRRRRDYRARGGGWGEIVAINLGDFTNGNHTDFMPIACIQEHLTGGPF